MLLLELPTDVLSLILQVSDTCLYTYRVCRVLNGMSRRVMGLGRLRRDVRASEVLRLLSPERITELSARVNHFYASRYTEDTEFPLRWTFLSGTDRDRVLVGTRAVSVGTMKVEDRFEADYLNSYLVSSRDTELVLSSPLLVEVLKRRVSLCRYSPEGYLMAEWRRIGRSQLERCIRESRIASSLESFLRYRLVEDSMRPLDDAVADRVRRERMNALPPWNANYRGGRMVDAIVRSLMQVDNLRVEGNNEEEEDREGYGVPFNSKSELRECWIGHRRLRMLLRCHNRGELGDPMKGSEEKVRGNVKFLVEDCNYGAMYEAINAYVEIFFRR